MAAAQAIRSEAIAPAQAAADLAEAATLLRTYAASLPVDLAYQGFDAEVAALPGPYAPPEGVLLVARAPGRAAVGCVAMRPLGGGICEMKRLYVAPAGRGTGLGRRLAEAVIAAAERAGHREMWLDTLPSMGAALTLYRALGFVPVPAYYETPVPGTVFLGRTLGARRA